MQVQAIMHKHLIPNQSLLFKIGRGEKDLKYHVVAINTISGGNFITYYIKI